MILDIKERPTSEDKISEKINEANIIWEKVYTHGRNITLDNYSRHFHFKTSHNILYLNKPLYKMGISNTKLCSYCKNLDETIIHLFYECAYTKNI